MSDSKRAFRYERKFLVDQPDPRPVRALVKQHPAMFYEPYPPRYVNNLYLDTADLANYGENVSGVADRHKVRIRWYGQLFGEISRPVLEFKIKRGLVGTKQSYLFTPFALDQSFDHRNFQKLLARAEVPPEVRHLLRDLQGVLCNRYYRWYFATRDQRFRVTIDTEMSFLQVKKNNNRFRRRYVDHHHVVVELKYGQELDPQADRISGRFPFSVTKNSKYVTGIEQVVL